jgi:hypothetical protein
MDQSSSWKWTTESVAKQLAFVDSMVHIQIEEEAIIDRQEIASSFRFLWLNIRLFLPVVIIMGIMLPRGIYISRSTPDLQHSATISSKVGLLPARGVSLVHNIVFDGLRSNARWVIGNR